LSIGILTIPPNLRSADSKGISCAEDGANSARYTVASEKETPPARPWKAADIPAPEETGASLSTEERPALEDFLWYTEDVALTTECRPMRVAQIIDQRRIRDSAAGKHSLFYMTLTTNYGANSAMELLNVDISWHNERSLRLTLDWYLMLMDRRDTERIDETDMDDCCI
jgi:hypothetical protein